MTECFLPHRQVTTAPAGRWAGLVLGAALAAVLLLPSPAAQAADYCVGSPENCSGIAKPGTAAGLQEALTEAEASAESDLVRVGAGTYTAPGPAGFEIDSPAHQITIQGEGPAATVLEGSGTNAVTLRVVSQGPDNSAVRDLGVKLSSGGGTLVGLHLTDGGADNVAVSAPPGLTSGRGALLAGYASFEGGSVTTPGLVGIETIGDNNVSHSSISARIGVRAIGIDLGITNSRIEADRLGVSTVSDTYLSDTLIRVSDGPAATEYGLLIGSSAEARHLTVVGAGDTTYGAIAAKAGGGTSSLTLSSSTLTGFAHELAASADALSTAQIDVSYSNYADGLALPGGVINPGFGNVEVAPGFVDAAGGDFHLRHDSPLIDASNDGPLPDDYDLDLKSRVIDGDGSGGPLPDMGAYEYQRAAPAAAIAGAASGTAGAALDFSGAGSSDPDPGDSLTYAWYFGDGATAAGQAASHSYAVPGTYPVTLKVTDPTGQQATATRDVNIAPAPPSGGSAPAGGTPAGNPSDTVAPILSELTVRPGRFPLGSGLTQLSATARRGATISFRLSEPARVTLRFARALTGRRAGRSTRYRRVPGAVALSGLEGLNRVRFHGRVSQRRSLRPGRYRVTVRARDGAGNVARPRAARFVLLRKAG